MENEKKLDCSISIETLEVSGLIPSLCALRLPHNRPCRSEYSSNRSFKGNMTDKALFNQSQTVNVCRDDILLLQALISKGDSHSKCVRGVLAYAKITAPIYFWCELETYRAGHERLSSSSTMHTQAKGLVGDELVKVKSEMPMGTTLTKIDYFSYQCLRNIVKQRSCHRLPEWQCFIEWVRTLPLAKELIFHKLRTDKY